jgi:hypothetical protein
MPPNMRAPLDCPRERSDIRLEVDLDGSPIFRTVLHPTGLYKDGVSTVYKRFEVKAGSISWRSGWTTTSLKPGFDYVKEEQITLAPGR